MTKSTMKQSPGNGQRGTTLIELMIALLVFAILVIGILPILTQATGTDLGAQSVTRSGLVAGEIMELLKMYRAMQNAGNAVPDDLGGFAITGDPVVIDGTGTWEVLQLAPDRYEMTYTLSADAFTGKLLATVGVTSSDTVAGSGGGNRWVEIASAIE